MGTLKLEVNIPEFENQITIEVTLKRDGKIECRQDFPATSNPAPTPELPRTNHSGNMMNADF